MIWLYMHVVVALNLWGNVVVYMIIWVFGKSCAQRKVRLIPVSNLRLLRYVFSILSLGLGLK